MPETPQPGITPPAIAGTALQDYLLCGIGSDTSRPRQQQERCREIRGGLHKGPLPVRTTPTEAEMRTERRLARELAIQNSPVLIPCAGGVGLDIVCVLDRAINGADRVYDTYVDHPPKPKALGERPPANLAVGPGRGRGKKK